MFHDLKFQKFMDRLYCLRIAVIVAIEHPALDISAYFNKIVGLCGRSDRLETDLYLRIHIDVEPDHRVTLESRSTAEEPTRLSTSLEKRLNSGRFLG